MKILYILRHAKSSWENPLLNDFDRPLNPRGLKTAPLMGQLASQKKLIPQKILTSPAKRAITTAELFCQSFKPRINILTVGSFYPGDPQDFIHALSQQEEHLPSVMIVGHNPGLEDLLENLTQTAETLPTASLAVIQLPINTWQDITTKPAGKLVQIYKPKELFKELG